MSECVSLLQDATAQHECEGWPSEVTHVAHVLHELQMSLVQSVNVSDGAFCRWPRNHLDGVEYGQWSQWREEPALNEKALKKFICLPHSLPRTKKWREAPGYLGTNAEKTVHYKGCIAAVAVTGGCASVHVIKHPCPSRSDL